jgi:predicted RNase H-like nuclease (RuvC/YqgF family)
MTPIARDPPERYARGMMTLDTRFNGVEAGLDDLQSGIEAGSRTVVSLREDAVRADRLLSTALCTAHAAGSLVRHTKELQACLRDQQKAMRELRQTMADLRQEMKAMRRTIRAQD